MSRQAKARCPKCGQSMYPKQLSAHLANGWYKG